METIAVVILVIAVVAILFISGVPGKKRERDLGGPNDVDGGGAGSLDEVEPIDKTKIED